jgi:hypothetical protein
VGLERGPLSLMSTIEELLGRESSGCGLENREYGHRDSACRPRNTLYPQKLPVTSPTSSGRSVGIVCSRIMAMEFVLFLLIIFIDFVWAILCACACVCVHACMRRV